MTIGRIRRRLRGWRRSLRVRRKLQRRRRRTRRARRRGIWHYPALAREDRRRNRRWCNATPRFLIVRHASLPDFYDPILDWIEAELPEVRRLFELRLLPCRVGVEDWSRFALHAPWLQDPVQQWSPRAYTRAMALTAECDGRGIPIINRVDRLPNAGKAAAARLIGSTGLRTPRMARIEDAHEFRETLLGLQLPLFVREDWGHGGAFFRADEPRDVEKIPVHLLRRPVAVEIVDVRSPDGIYRKHRYLVAGEEGVPQQLHFSDSWITRGTRSLHSEAFRDEELAYMEGPDPHHQAFQLAAKALGLDFVAFDFGYQDGRIVIWEANPFPYFRVPRGRRRYRGPAIERGFAALAKLYLTRAGLPVPAELDDQLAARTAGLGETG